MSLGDVQLRRPYRAGSIGIELTAPVGASPTRVTIYSASSGLAISTIYAITAVSGNQITLGSVIAGTDQNYNAGDPVSLQTVTDDIVTPAIAAIPAAPVNFTWLLATGTDATIADDVGSWFTATSKATLTGGTISAKTAPVGDSLAYAIKYKRGVASFAPITAVPAGLPTLLTTENYDTFTLNPTFSLLVGDILRIDCTGIGSGTPGKDVTVQLVGTVAP